MDTIVLYLEFLAQKNFKACSLRNNVAALKHFFALFDWPVKALTYRRVQLLLKSVKMNVKMNVKIKGVISISMLKRLMKIVHKFYNGVTHKALFLVAYFGFFPLASLLPPQQGHLIKQDTSQLTMSYGVSLGHISSLHVQKICKIQVNIM